jgi:hypothetical protein
MLRVYQDFRLWLLQCVYVCLRLHGELIVLAMSDGTIKLLQQPTRLVSDSDYGAHSLV